MDLGILTTTTEAHALIGMVHYYRDICPRHSHILDPLIETASIPKCRKILWNDALEESLKELNHMVPAETLLSYKYWKVTLTVQIDASNKKLEDVICKNNKPITF